MLRGIGTEIGKIKDRQKALNDVLNRQTSLGRNGSGLVAGYAISELKEVEARLGRIRTAQKKLAEAQERSERITARAGKVAAAGATVTVAGSALLASTVPGIKEAKRMQAQQARIAGLGFTADDTKELIGAAMSAKSYGVSQEQAAETARDLASAFGDVHHAIKALPLALKQRAALKLYDSNNGTDLAEHAAYSMAKVIELRNGTKSPEEYAKQANMAHQVLVATGGRVNGEQLQAAIKTGGIAAKGMSNEAFYYGGSHFMQEMGGDTFGTASMSLYQALAQGHLTKRAADNLDKFGLIGDRSKVKEDKAGQVKFMDPGALVGYDTFAKDPQAWVEKYFIPVLKKHGIDPDDMQKVAEVSGMIISNRNGANLLASRVAQRAVVAKEFANAQRADNIDQGSERVNGTAPGAEMDAEAKLADLKLRLGTEILPLYTKGLTLAADALERLNKFTADHPDLAKAMMVGITGIGGALVVLGPILGVASGAMTLYAALQLRAATNATAAAVAIGEETAAITAQGVAANTAGGALAAFAKRALAVVALANVADYAAGKFGIGGKAIDQEQDDKNWNAATTWEKVKSGAPRLIEHAGRLIGMTNMANEAQAERIAGETKYLQEQGRMPSSVPAMRGSQQAPAAAPSITNNFDIKQFPGESTDELARRVADYIKRQQGVQQRGALTDGPQ